LGLSPILIFCDQKGFIVTGGGLDRADVGWSLEHGPLPLETSTPGVFAIGDARQGSVKRVASAVGEGAIAVRHIHEYLAAPVDLVGVGSRASADVVS
jgi:thioredoxin reductase (NADPH)